MTKNILGKTLGTLGSQWRDALARAIIERKISPNILTIIGFMINLLGGVLLIFGATIPTRFNWIHVLAGGVILIANIFDMLDGAVARMSNRVTRFGAFCDSVTDRYSDMILLGGAIAYFAWRRDLSWVIISVLALVGSVMTSYTRARAESLLPGKFDAGYMERPERIVILAVTCLVSRLYMGMLIIAVFSNLATFHRIWDAWQVDHNLEHPEDARRYYGSPHSPFMIRTFRNLIFWSYPRQTWQHDVLGIVLFILILVAPLRF
ncbi:MAG: CDP-alcohol phosphatidyltransferase family protein [Candidatus Vecturithrix sp.]|jgi:CDP-diacylglycerol--glycerol-3-phosphate 3-phosphatidyltransferase|nr:CDP-alcohol phosphatidyltransferase family protein [Candidatus Vecturithrix sp.]